MRDGARAPETIDGERGAQDDEAPLHRMTSGLFCDLHIHSCFSIASSSRMLPSCLVEGCRRKGIGVLGGGDALHAGWRDLWNRIPDTGEVLVVPAGWRTMTEITTLIILGLAEQFEDLASDLGRHAARLAETGRPHVGSRPGAKLQGGSMTSAA